MNTPTKSTYDFRSLKWVLPKILHAFKLLQQRRQTPQHRPKMQSDGAAKTCPSGANDGWDKEIGTLTLFNKNNRGDQNHLFYTLLLTNHQVYVSQNQQTTRKLLPLNLTEGDMEREGKHIKRNDLINLIHLVNKSKKKIKHNLIYLT